MTTLIVPIYNSEGIIPDLLATLHIYIASRTNPIEVIMVNDGSTDATRELLEQAEYPWLKILHLPQNTGKGGAIQSGIFAARSELVIFTDADLPYDLEVIDRAEKALNSGASVVAGSRHSPESRSAVTIPLRRRLSSLVFSFAANLVLLSPISDTQCGLKGFTRVAARELFADLQTSSFAFDVEILYRAQSKKYPIVLLPVFWKNNGNSSVSLGRDSVLMFKDLGRLYMRTKHEGGRIHRQLIRYVIVGIINTCVNVAFLNLFMFVSGIHNGRWVVVFSLVSFLITVIQAFFWNKYWVFQHSGFQNSLRIYGSFFAVASIMAIVAAAILYTLTTIIGAPHGISPALWANIAIAITIPISFIGNFLGNRLLVFKTTSPIAPIV
jgi:dolichyl-phosphate beta-glucosyltransferase